MAISFADTDLPVDDEIISAFQAAFDSMASAGSWLTGEQRVAIAEEVRLAAAGGRSASGGPLSDSTKDLVARMVNDSSGFDADFANEIISSGLGDGAYVETVGLVARFNALEYFCTAIGIPKRRLPGPLPGEPDQQRPADAADLGAYVEQLGPAEFAAKFGEQFAEIPNIMRALSLVAAETIPTMRLGAGLYLSNVLQSEGRRGLSKTQIELVASRTSFLNECFY